MFAREIRWVAALDRFSLFLLLLLAATFIPLPIVYQALGEKALRIGVMVGVMVQAVVVSVLLARAWPLRRLLRTVLTVVALGWAVEYLGSQTGFPFGHYDYTSRLQPQVGGVPLLIPLAWLMMLPPSWAVASWIAPVPGEDKQGLKGWFLFALVASLAMTAWDLFLDPQMVAWGFWVWEQPSGYFGVPWINFLGWMLVTFGMTLVVRPRHLPAAPLTAVYALTWLLEFVGQLLFWDLPGPAVCGFLGMGAILLWARWSQGRESQ